MSVVAQVQVCTKKVYIYKRCNLWQKKNLFCSLYYRVNNADGMAFFFLTFNCYVHGLRWRSICRYGWSYTLGLLLLLQKWYFLIQCCSKLCLAKISFLNCCSCCITGQFNILSKNTFSACMISQAPTICCVAANDMI